MGIHQELAEIARTIVNELHMRIPALNQQLLDIETQKKVVVTRLRAARLAHDRLTTFTPELGGHLQCPRCWYESGKQSEVLAMGGGETDARDFFKCEIGHDFSLPA